MNGSCFLVLCATLVACAASCLGGYYNKTGHCFSCPDGTFSVAGATSCTSCPTGQICGSNSICDGKCHQCNGGYHASSKHDACPACPNGKYSSAGVDECTDCPTGHICGQNSICDGKCHECNGGYHANSKRDACPACPNGKYSSAGVDECTDCPTGHICGQNSICDGKCHECNGGYYANSKRDACPSCPNGKYSSAGADECTDCPTGHICGQNSICDGTCHKCNGGYYANSARDACPACPNGKYSSAGADECADCPVGSVCGSNSICDGQCHQCNDGYTSNAERAACISCEASKPCISKARTDQFNSHLVQVALNDSCGFLLGTVKGLVSKEIGDLKTLAKVPDDMATVFGDWHDLQWGDGPAIAHALKDSTTAAIDVWNVLSAYTPLPAALKRSCEVYVAAVAPELVVVYESGKYLFHLYEHSKDVTEHVGSFYNGIATGDYEHAGEAFGGLIKDGLALKKDEQHENDEKASERVVARGGTEELAVTTANYTRAFDAQRRQAKASSNLSIAGAPHYLNLVPVPFLHPQFQVSSESIVVV